MGQSGENGFPPKVRRRFGRCIEGGGGGPLKVVGAVVPKLYILALLSTYVGLFLAVLPLVKE